VHIAYKILNVSTVYNNAVTVLTPYYLRILLATILSCNKPHVQQKKVNVSYQLILNIACRVL